MKKAIFILFCLLSLGSNAQTIGDHFNYINEQKPGGEIKVNNGNYTYSYIDPQTGSLWMYFFNVDLRCICIAISTSTTMELNSFVRNLNENWVAISDRVWNYYRNDGTILEMSIQVVEDVGQVFFIAEK